MFSLNFFRYSFSCLSQETVTYGYNVRSWLAHTGTVPACDLMIWSGLPLYP